MLSAIPATNNNFVFKVLPWAHICRVGCEKFGSMRRACLSSMSTDADAGKRMEQSENIQNPQDQGDNNYGIEDRLDRALHGKEVIHQPQQDSDYDQNFHNLE